MPRKSIFLAYARIPCLDPTLITEPVFVFLSKRGEQSEDGAISTKASSTKTSIWPQVVEESVAVQLLVLFHGSFYFLYAMS